VAWSGERLDGALSESLEALERAHAAAFGQNPPNLDLSKEERAMAGKVFVPVADLVTADDALKKTKPASGLHPMMAFEVLNFADGRRNAHEVYEAVAAEALSAGEFYYGTVAPADVLETLERAARAGAFTVKGK
jgi:hypothetical protein